MPQRSWRGRANPSAHIATDAAIAERKKPPLRTTIEADPVGTGLVASLARPGTNVTGYSLLSPKTDAKRLSLLRELLPAARRVGEPANSTNPLFRAKCKDLDGAKPGDLPVEQPTQFELGINLKTAKVDFPRYRGQRAASKRPL